MKREIRMLKTTTVGSRYTPVTIQPVRATDGLGPGPAATNVEGLHLLNIRVPGEIKRSRDLRWSWTLKFAQKRS